MLIVGLGNPGKEYENTRHNIGRDLLFEMVNQRGDPYYWKNDRYTNSMVAEMDEMVMVLPETFMNRSGEAVRLLVKKYNLEAQRVVVLYDDIDLAVGSIKISKDRGAGGHNGVQSIIDHLGTTDFVRVRIGICPVDDEGVKTKPHKEQVRHFVLARFSPEERSRLEVVAEKLPRILSSIKNEGAEEAMNYFNRKDYRIVL